MSTESNGDIIAAVSETTLVVTSVDKLVIAAGGFAILAGGLLITAGVKALRATKLEEITS